jgi:hypothetical protein
MTPSPGEKRYLLQVMPTAQSSWHDLVVFETRPTPWRQSIRHQDDIWDRWHKVRLVDRHKARQ